MHLYENINEEQFSQNHTSSKYKKILFNLCFFHSILTERKKFLNLGWNKIYNFTDLDFEVKHFNNKSILILYYNTPPYTLGIIP